MTTRNELLPVSHVYVGNDLEHDKKEVSVFMSRCNKKDGFCDKTIYFKAESNLQA